MNKLAARVQMAVGTVLMCFGANAQALDAKRVDLDIKKQPVVGALKQLGEQTGLQLLMRVDDRSTDSIVVQAVAGEHSIKAALDKLLANTGLTYEFINDRTVRILRADSKPTSWSSLAGVRALRVADAGQRLTTSETSSSQDGATKNTPLEQIVVTARKRDENIQDVPISIAVVTSADIDRRGLVNAEDYLRGIPGVNQVEAGGGGGQAVVIRGLETSPSYNNFFSGATVATYFGETPTTGSASLIGGSNVDIKLVDIDRVEVLRGPQGTAFGSSAMGGAVRTIPVAPRLESFEGRVNVGYSSTSEGGGDNYNVQLVGNLPLIADKLAVRAVAYQYQDSGFYRNRAGSDAAFRAARVTPYGAEAFALDEDGVGAYKVMGGRIAARYQATDDLSFSLSYLKQKNETDGWPFQNSARAYDQTTLRVAPEHVMRGEELGVSDSDLDLLNATVEQGFSWGTLLATYSYLDGGFARAYSDSAFELPYPRSYQSPDDYHRANSAEVRVSTKLEGQWNFLGGLYYEDTDDLYDYNVIWFGDPATDVFAPGQRILGDSRDQRNVRQKAAFSEVSWQLTPQLTLTGGARYYDYDRTTSLNTVGPFFGTSSTRQASDESGTTFRANVSYKPTDDALVYAGWAQGFRLGKPQVLARGNCDTNGDNIVDATSTTIEAAQQVESDSTNSFEVGGKLTMLDGRLVVDTAAFLMDWTDIPVTVRPTPSCFYNANAGTATTKGVELQASSQLTRALRIDLGASWLDAELTRDVPAQGFRDGDRLPGSPKFNANLGAQYAFNVAGNAAFVRADAVYVGSFFGNVLQTPTLEAGDYVKIDAKARVSLRDFNLDLYVQNLTNEDAYTFRGAFIRGPYFGYRLRPRTVGVQLSYDF